MGHPDCGRRYRLDRLFEVGALLVGCLAAFLVGVSKTGLPGAAMIATPLIATVTTGRMIAGTVVPILLLADVFAIAWYRQYADWRLLRSLTGSLAVGFAAGALYFIVVGENDRVVTISMGVIVLLVVAAQAVRFRRQDTGERRAPSATATAVFGTAGGFTTFVANAAGPILNSFLVSAGVNKQSFIGTSAWFYFGVNVAKIPLYLALGEFSDGGPFITGETLTFFAAVAPFVVVGVYTGRRLFVRLPQRTFLWIVLAFAAVGGLNLLRA